MANAYNGLSTVGGGAAPPHKEYKMLTNTVIIVRWQNELATSNKALAKASSRYRNLLKTFGADNGFTIGAYNRVKTIKARNDLLRECLSK